MKRAPSLGADALVRREVKAFYQPPVRVYDPTFASMFYPRYRDPDRSFYPAYGFSPFPYEYRWIGGGDVQILKAVAIRCIKSDAPAVTHELCASIDRQFWRARPDSNGRPSASEADTLSS